jgi:hypothetical protein
MTQDLVAEPEPRGEASRRLIGRHEMPAMAIREQYVAEATGERSA